MFKTIPFIWNSRFEGRSSSEHWLIHIGQFDDVFRDFQQLYSSGDLCIIDSDSDNSDRVIRLVNIVKLDLHKWPIDFTSTKSFSFSFSSIVSPLSSASCGRRGPPNRALDEGDGDGKNDRVWTANRINWLSLECCSELIGILLCWRSPWVSLRNYRWN